MQIDILSNWTCIEGSPYLQYRCLLGGTQDLQWRGDIPGNVTISCSNSPTDFTTISGVRIQTNKTDTGCISTLSLSAGTLPVDRSINLTCQNIQLRTEYSICYVVPKGEGTYKVNFLICKVDNITT